VIEELIARMAALLESLRAEGDQRQYFHATYQRTTIAVAAELRRGGFTDTEWVERWDVAEDDELAAISGPGSALDRLLRPLNRLGTRRFLREARGARRERRYGRTRSC
jgi:hypothetical protein